MDLSVTWEYLYCGSRAASPTYFICKCKLPLLVCGASNSPTSVRDEF